MTRSLKQRVVLPSQQKINMGAVQTALNVSRAVIHIWRRDHEFPKHERCGNNVVIDTQLLAQWLHKQGVSIKWL